MDMKNRLIPCVLACLMIFLVGCNGNTAKEAAQEITKTETSFPAGNTETDSQEETAEEPESTTVQEETQTICTGLLFLTRLTNLSNFSK